MKERVSGAAVHHKGAVTGAGTGTGNLADASGTQVEDSSNSTLKSLMDDSSASRTLEEAAVISFTASGVESSPNGAATGLSKEIPVPPSAALHISTALNTSEDATSMQGGAVKSGDIAVEAAVAIPVNKPSATAVLQSADTERRVVLRPIVPFSLSPPSSSDPLQGSGSNSSSGSSQPASLPSASTVLEQAEKPLKKLLKVLHVCARYERCTGKPLPESIDFFGKTLLGMTSIR